jgi:ABC-2 type transport system ATP-binding protein
VILEMSAAELHSVTKRFGSKPALDAVSFQVEQGLATALIGPNGAGKSTALALLLGLRRPDAGTVRLLGCDPRSPATRCHVGAALQDSAFPATLRVRELIQLIRAHYEDALPASTVVDRFQLGGLLHRQLGGLSGGERRRLGVALAFAGDPRLVVLDEPTAGLDRETREAVWDAIRAHVHSGGAVLLTTHQLGEADALADRIVQLKGGVVVAEGSLAELRARAGSALIRFRSAPGSVVDGATRHGAFLSLVTGDVVATVDRLVREGVPLTELEVRPLTLEEALACRREGG